MPTTKNIIIFIAIGAVVVLGYVLFFKKSPEEKVLVSAPTPFTQTQTPAPGGAAAKDFLTLLLSVRSIKLDDAIFSNVAFTSLDPSHSIILVPDGSEGRPNPFAPFGSDTTATPPNTPANNPGGNTRP